MAGETRKTRERHTTRTCALLTALAVGVTSVTVPVSPAFAEETSAAAEHTTAGSSQSQDPLLGWMIDTANQLTEMLTGMAVRLGLPQDVQDTIRRVIIDVVAVATGWRAVDSILNTLNRQQSLDSPADVVLQHERVLVNKVSEERVRQGLAPVEWDDTVATSALSWANHLSDSTKDAPDVQLTHDTGSYYYNHAGELLFGGRGSWVDADRAFTDWMISPGHRAALMHPQHRYAGAAIVQRYGKTYIVLRLSPIPGAQAGAA